MRDAGLSMAADGARDGRWCARDDDDGPTTLANHPNATGI
jgi:hypothetical protein